MCPGTESRCAVWRSEGRVVSLPWKRLAGAGSCSLRADEEAVFTRNATQMHLGVFTKK